MVPALLMIANQDRNRYLVSRLPTKLRYVCSKLWHLQPLLRSIVQQVCPLRPFRPSAPSLTMAQSSSASETHVPATPKTNLGARLAKLRDPALNLSMTEIEALSLEKHGAFLVDFGTKMKGRSYLECVEEAADWTKWFVEHYHDSSKRNHQIFLCFVEKYVSQAEQLAADLSGEPPVTTGDKALRELPSTKAIPKARSKPDGPEIPWELLEEPTIHDQVATLSGRMSQMEQVMQEMIVAIRQLNPPPSSS